MDNSRMPMMENISIAESSMHENPREPPRLQKTLTNESVSLTEQSQVEIFEGDLEVDEPVRPLKVPRRQQSLQEALLEEPHTDLLQVPKPMHAPEVETFKKYLETTDFLEILMSNLKHRQESRG